MTKERKRKTCIETGQIPKVIQNGTAFKFLTKSTKREHIHSKKIYRKKLYKIMDELLGVDRPKNKSSYIKYFSDPEKNVNQAFLSNQRSNERKWHQFD